MPQSNYARIIDQNLAALFSRDMNERSEAMGAEIHGQKFYFTAFDGKCCIAPEGIHIDGKLQDGPLGIILSLYALNAVYDPIRIDPFKAFKEFPDSMPYVGAFTSHTEQILVPSVAQILQNQQRILDAMGGEPAPAAVGGDSAFLIRPLPKIALCYIFYEADEDFPPSVTCLYSSNADRFIPMDGLADVGEYASRAILKIVT